MQFDSEHVVTDFTQRVKTEQSLKGIKKMYQENKNEALEFADEIIKNIYRILMTRGMNGCYVYCEDLLLQYYLKERLND